MLEDLTNCGKFNSAKNSFLKIEVQTKKWKWVVAKVQKLCDRQDLKNAKQPKV